MKPLFPVLLVLALAAPLHADGDRLGDSNVPLPAVHGCSEPSGDPCPQNAGEESAPAVCPPPDSVGIAADTWNPMNLKTDVSEPTARALQQDSDSRRAELGYLYSLPAYLHLRQRYEFLHNFQAYMGDSGNPYGRFLLMREPSSPATRDVMPNYDTLYGATFLDLRESPMVLQVPEIPGRYFSLALLDAYFYNFAYVGSRTTGQKAGNYLIVGPGWKGRVPAGIAQVIESPTRMMNVYQRIYFKDKADLPAVNRIQDQIRIVPIAAFLDPEARPDLPDPQNIVKLNPPAVKTPIRMLEMTNAYMALNPPPVEDRMMLEHFATVGIGPGLTAPDTAEGRSILHRGTALAEETMSALAVVGSQVRNGWQIPSANAGKRGGPGGMAFHAMTQLRSIGLNQPEEAAYYTAYIDSGNRPLRSSQNYTMRFTRDTIPPVLKERFGFWSITLYKRSDYRLADNPANKYVVRSGDPLFAGDDGSLTIYVQKDPPADNRRHANWLPAPAAGEFVLTLRVYCGEPSVVAGSYTPPRIEAAQ